MNTFSFIYGWLPVTFIRAKCFTSIKNLAILPYCVMTLPIVLSIEIIICSALLFIHNTGFGIRIIMTIFRTGTWDKAGPWKAVSEYLLAHLKSSWYCRWAMQEALLCDWLTPLLQGVHHYKNIYMCEF